jgi:hypothetical protein
MMKMKFELQLSDLAQADTERKRRERSRKEFLVRFLVSRVDATVDTTGIEGFPDNRNTPQTQQFWPIIVEATNHEDAARVAYGQTKLPVNWRFLVIAMIDSEIVEFKPKQEYEVVRRPLQ